MTKTTLMALVEASGLREVIDDAYLERGDWTPFVERFVALAQEEMRERCIEEVRGVGGIDAIEVERLIRALEVKP